MSCEVGILNEYSCDMQRFLFDSGSIAATCVVVAIIVMMIVEVQKFAVRKNFVRRFLDNWQKDQRGKDFSKLKSESDMNEILGLEPFAYSLPTAQLMRQLQNSADQAIEYPERLRDRLEIFAGRQSQDDVAALSGGSSSTNDAGSSSRIVDAAVETRVATEIERTLDAIQLHLRYRWLAHIRKSALVWGVVVILVLAGLSDILQLNKVVGVIEFVGVTIVMLAASISLVVRWPFGSKFFEQNRTKTTSNKSFARVLNSFAWQYLLAAILLISWFAYVFSGPNSASPNTLILLGAMGLISGFTSTIVYDLLGRLTGKKRV